MGQITGDTNFWLALLTLAGRNMWVAVILLMLGILTALYLLSLLLNRIAAQAFGRKELVVPIFTRWCAEKVSQAVPVLASKVTTYLAKTRQTRKPMTRNQRIVYVIANVLMLAILGFMFVVYGVVYYSNAGLNTFETSRGGILVEVRAYAQPTDGFMFDIQFDRPSEIVGIWTDVPSAKAKSNAFDIRTTETVGFSDNRDGTKNVVSALYPSATPKRSVFLYFKPKDNRNEQLKVESVNFRK